VKARTSAGRAAAWLLLACVASTGVFVGVVWSGQRGGPTFVSNLWLTVPALTAAATAIAGGAIGAWAIATRRERGVVVIVAAAVGLLVALWVSLEIALPH
jgi:hypothetical protein